jgi:GMP synthase (glutamine-hydrolysing)
VRQRLEEAARELGPVEITVVRGPEGQIPADLSGFDGAVLSGSKTRIYEDAPWIEKELAAIRALHSLKIPTLGICYGEQMIVRALAGQQFTDAAKHTEHGWAEVELRGDSPILRGLPEKFHTFEFHSDEVTALPSGFRLTASSNACPVQAFDVEGAPMWGVQFHPERELEAGNRSLDRRLAENPNFPALNRDRAEALYDPSVGRTIFTNFLRQVWAKR